MATTPHKLDSVRIQTPKTKENHQLNLPTTSVPLPKEAASIPSASPQSQCTCLLFSAEETAGDIYGNLFINNDELAPFVRFGHEDDGVLQTDTYSLFPFIQYKNKAIAIASLTVNPSERLPDGEISMLELRICYDIACMLFGQQREVQNNLPKDQRLYREKFSIKLFLVLQPCHDPFLSCQTYIMNGSIRLVSCVWSISQVIDYQPGKIPNKFVFHTYTISQDMPHHRTLFGFVNNRVDEEVEKAMENAKTADGGRMQQAEEETKRSGVDQEVKEVKEAMEETDRGLQEAETTDGGLVQKAEEDTKSSGCEPPFSIVEIPFEFAAWCK